MSKLCFTLILSIVLLTTPSVMAKEVLLPGVQYLLIFDHRPLSELYSVLCETEECDIYQSLSTTKNCVETFERYFMKSGGSLPTCIPKFIDRQPEDPMPRDELWCYANVRLLVQEECDPLYDPTVDAVGVINESNLTPTPYEICLRNRAAQNDVCGLTLDLHCGAYCYSLYITPCYDEYEITGDQAALDTCLADAQPLTDQCLLDNQCGGDTYLYPNKICIAECRSQYPPDTVPCYDEYEITGDQEALNACLANAQLPRDQCIINECGGDQRIYPGFIIINY